MRTLFGQRNFYIALFLILAILPFRANQYYLFISNMVLIYIILALGLNLLIGFAGQLAFANAAMFGIGAYGTGLLQAHFGLPYWLCAPAGALLAMAVGTGMALPALRLQGIYLALATLAFAQTTIWVMMHWTTVTFGAGGFSPPPVDFSMLGLDTEYGMYYLCWITAIVLLWLAHNLMRSTVGRAFVAMRDGDVAAEALGVNLLRTKTLAFALSGFYAGTAGALYSGVLGFVGPESFDLLQMILHKTAVVVGGIGSIAGSVIGAVLLVTMMETMREFKATIEIAFGAMLLGFVLFQPKGIVDLLKRRVPGWNDALHYRAGTEADVEPPTTTRDDPAQSDEKLVEDRA